MYEDSAKIAATAENILRSAGKTEYTADEYAFGQALERALEEVENDVPARIAAKMAEMPAAAGVQ